MTDYHQAAWNEPLIYEKSKNGHKGHLLESNGENKSGIPEDMKREKLKLPQLSEPEVVRHFTRLSQMNYGIDSGIYPLGSCTMKYNPKTLEEILHSESVESIHPEQPEETIQGSLEIMHKLKDLFKEITGMDYFTLQPSAGAQGEFTAMNLVRRYLKDRGKESSEILVPDSAHGTNPISARMAGFKVVEIPSNERGRVDMDALKPAVSDETAGIMLTNPNTLGLFEDKIGAIVDLIHDKDGLLFYDGANLNSIMGKARPGDMGFDLLHLNLHKTFAAHHGGGGPGSGPVGVRKDLETYLPKPRITRDRENDIYKLDGGDEKSEMRVHPYFGNFEVLLKAYAYIRLMGPEGLEKASETAVLNANYLQEKARKIEGIDIEYGFEEPCKHETVLSCRGLKSKAGISAMDVGKRLLDYGVHSPTLYFPNITEESMMTEPTETVSKDELDKYLDALTQVAEESLSNPETVKKAPHKTSIDRLDQTKASRDPILSWKMFKKKAMR